MNFNVNFGGFTPGGQGADFSQFQQRPRSAPKPRKPIGTPATRTIINILVTVVFALVYFYTQLPAINLHSESFYAFVFLCCAVYCGCALFTSGFQGNGAKGYFTFVKKQCAVPAITFVALVAVILVGSIASSILLRADAYSKLLPLETGDFAADIHEISYDQIPMLDDDSAARLGSRKLGELADMVSQFEVMGTYTQINYQGRPVRVSSLRYGDLVKWITNRQEGLPAYVIIDMTTQNAEVVRLEEGMKYTTAEHFSRNLYRHLRFRYPTYMFDEPVFEIDEDGTPYWVCSRIVKRIGLFGGTDIDGAVLVNAITGESDFYAADEIPSWVDRVFTADIIIQQYDYYGQYHNGFLNSMFGQRDVTVTTDGYNYLVIGDDVYMYTGVTSVTSDESNIGFILTNQRTKETRFYSIAGAEEYSAQASAQSKVQQMNYIATFPLLLNIADQPTYFMALKGNDGLVKMYAMVNVRQYSIVATGTTVAECEQNYRNDLVQNGLIDESKIEIEEENSETLNGIIEEIRTAVINGNSHYFLQLAGNDRYFVISAAEDADAVILSVGDAVQILHAKDAENLLVPAYSVNILQTAKN